MSTRVVATLNNISVCKRICEEVTEQAITLEKSLQVIEKRSSNILDENAKAHIKSLREESQNAISLAESISSQLIPGMEIDNYFRLAGEARNLLSRINYNGAVSIKALNDLLSELLRTSISTSTSGGRKIRAEREGAALDEYLKTVKNTEVAFVVKMLIRNPKYGNLSFEEIRLEAERRLDPSKAYSEKESRKKASELKAKMEAANVDSEVIEKIVGTPEGPPKNTLEMVEAASMAIVSEKARKDAIKGIISSIRARGFIVEKKNIRHFKETDTVVVAAMKPGGQKADFHVKVDGSFVYHFDEYEGQACQKDIEPFLKDLEEIYGLKLKDQKTTWSNPDRDMKMAYQATSVRRIGE